MNNKLIFAAGAAVALVILVDLATGQGPPIYNNYLRAREEMQPMPGPHMMGPGGYLAAPGQPMGPVYGAEPKELDKEYGKSEKFDKKEELKEKLREKEYEEKEYGHGQGDKKTTASPGIYDRFMKSFGR